MFQKTLTLIAFIVFSFAAAAQSFVSPADAFSHKKTTYVTLDDGTQLVGTIRDLDRKKGLIEEIKMELEDGSRRKIDPSEIAFAYLPPNNFDKLMRASDFLTDATKWDNTDLDADIIGQGYAYFEKTEVRIKNKTRTLLLQLMNPHFSGRVKVFYDPFAKETMSLGVAGIDVVGGLDKSYYIKLGNDTAYRVKKKEYDEECKLIFAGCDAVLNDEEMGVWRNFEGHVYQYAQACGE